MSLKKVDSQPEEQWVFGSTTFQTWEQKGYPSPEYAVKCVPADSSPFWLEHPESSFETVGGARMAVLCFLEDQK